MNCNQFVKPLIGALAVVAIAAAAFSDAEPVGSAFTYQGLLLENGEPVHSEVDLVFRLFNAEVGGNQVGQTLAVNGAVVERGLFTVHLDFGEQVLTSNARWLEIEVEGVTLAPRQPVRPAPYALALPGLRTLQNATSPNIVGGFSGNVVDAAIVGATIAGGGDAEFPNEAHGNQATIGGGRGNIAIGNRSTVSGGLFNEASGATSTIGGGAGNTASGDVSTVGGGELNNATGFKSTVAGGDLNTAGGSTSTVGGGFSNHATGLAATVPGGSLNTAAGQYSFAAGRRAKANHNGAFVWADSTSADFSSTSANQFLIRAFRVGIGTNAPQRKLHVVGDRIRLSDPTGAKTIDLRADGNKVDLTALSTDLFLGSDGPAGNNHIIMNQFGGGVGIGTAAPGGFKLAVNGSAAKPGGGSWSSFSDERLKHSIEPIEQGMLDRLLSLNGYEFEYTDDAIDRYVALPGRQIGLLAHEVAVVFPDWVDEDDDGFLFVTERGVTAIVVEALRDLRAEKDAEIDALRDEVAELRLLLAELLSERKGSAQ